MPSPAGAPGFKAGDGPREQGSSIASTCAPMISEEPAEATAQSLLDCLDRQLHLIQTLIRLADEKREVILKRRTARLVELLHQEMDAVQELACREEERVRLGARLGMASDSRVEDWLPRLPAGCREKVRERAARLREEARRLQSLTTANDALVQQELAYIRFAIDVLAGPSTQDLTYGPPREGRGGKDEGHGGLSADRSLFDFKA